MVFNLHAIGENIEKIDTKLFGYETLWIAIKGFSFKNQWSNLEIACGEEGERLNLKVSLHVYLGMKMCEPKDDVSENRRTITEKIDVFINDGSIEKETKAKCIRLGESRRIFN